MRRCSPLPQGEGYGLRFSCLLDPPSLFILGIMLFLAGNRFELERLANIALSIIIFLSFVLFSSCLYDDVFKCAYLVIGRCPDGNRINSSGFMPHSAIWPYIRPHRADVSWILMVATSSSSILWPFTSATPWSTGIQRPQNGSEGYLLM